MDLLEALDECDGFAVKANEEEAEEEDVEIDKEVEKVVGARGVSRNVRVDKVPARGQDSLPERGGEVGRDGSETGWDLTRQ